MCLKLYNRYVPLECVLEVSFFVTVTALSFTEVREARARVNLLQSCFLSDEGFTVKWRKFFVGGVY